MAETRFCGRCQQWLPDKIELHECAPALQKKRYEWQCEDCKGWYEPKRGQPNFGHVCTSARKPVNAKRLVERLALPPSAGVKLLSGPEEPRPAKAKSKPKSVHSSVHSVHSQKPVHSHEPVHSTVEEEHLEVDKIKVDKVDSGCREVDTRSREEARREYEREYKRRKRAEAKAKAG